MCDVTIITADMKYINLVIVQTINIIISKTDPTVWHSGLSSVVQRT